MLFMQLCIWYLYSCYSIIKDITCRLLILSRCNRPSVLRISACSSENMADHSSGNRGVLSLFYVVFKFAILKFDLKTPGREDDDADETTAKLANDNFTEVAKIILEGIGGKENVASIDNCITRLRSGNQRLHSC